jgi:aryl-alcohol dehydrogenase-like predicted oxidoreductase
MKYRAIPNTELRLSEIGFGCGGNAGLMVRGTRAEQSRVIARALDHGINYFDLAPDYGDGLAETNLGLALKEIGHRPLLNSKVEIREANLKDIAQHVVTSTEASLSRLDVDYLDILQIHNGPITPAPTLRGRDYRQLSTEDYLRSDGAVEGIARLRETGKIRAAGFICRGDDEADFKRLLESGVFSLINVPYTLLNPTAGMAKSAALQVQPDYGNAITHALSNGVSTAIYSPLAGGYLTDQMIAGVQHPLARSKDLEAAEAKRMRDIARGFSFLKDVHSDTLAKAAVRFVLSHPGVTTVLGGFPSIEQLDELALVSDMPPLPEDKLDRLENIWSSNFYAIDD